MWKSCHLSWTHPPLRHRSLGNTASPILLWHRDTTAAVAVSGLTRPMSEKAGKVAEAVLWSLTVSVDTGGMNLPTFRCHSMNTYSWASCLDSFSSWDWATHFSGVWFTLPMSGTDEGNCMSEVLFTSAMLLGLLFGRVGGRQKQTPAHTAAHLQTAGTDGAHENTSASRG